MDVTHARRQQCNYYLLFLLFEDWDLCRITEVGSQYLRKRRL
jgi:hypothetical protein